MPRENDESIGDDVVLWRAVYPDQIEIVDNTEKPESWAFKDREEEVSAYIASETTLEWFHVHFPDDRVAEFTAGDARRCGHSVARDPTPEAPFHVVLCPLPGSGNKKLKNRKMLCKLSKVLPG